MHPFSAFPWPTVPSSLSGFRDAYGAWSNLHRFLLPPFPADGPFMALAGGEWRELTAEEVTFLRAAEEVHRTHDRTSYVLTGGHGTPSDMAALVAAEAEIAARTPGPPVTLGWFRRGLEPHRVGDAWDTAVVQAVWYDGVSAESYARKTAPGYRWVGDGCRGTYTWATPAEAKADCVRSQGTRLLSESGEQPWSLNNHQWAALRQVLAALPEDWQPPSRQYLAKGTCSVEVPAGAVALLGSTEHDDCLFVGREGEFIGSGRTRGYQAWVEQGLSPRLYRATFRSALRPLGRGGASMMFGVHGPR